MFPTTRWTLVLSAREGSPEARRAALGTLLSSYWRPVYVYLRRKGLAPEAAEDAVQGLFLRLLEQDAIARLDPGRGRFRSYLLTSLEHHLVNLHEHDSALKRGGGERVVPLETVDVERELPSAPEDPRPGLRPGVGPRGHGAGGGAPARANTGRAGGRARRPPSCGSSAWTRRRAMRRPPRSAG